MLPIFKALALALLYSTAILGAAVEIPGHFEIKAQLKGIDISNYQRNVDWKDVVAHGVSFVYIKATEGTSKGTAKFAMRYADISSSIQKPFLLFAVYRRHKSGPHSWWISLCSSR
jgi:GH25 family lysozyme M1 (1,4-beta-N-acetylmuramidase)